ncbi:MAG: hypothetical protein QXG00_05525 [Candidatus Woesearchaeota archaeon]
MASIKIDINYYINSLIMSLKNLPDDQKYAILAIFVGLIVIITAIIIW